MIKKFDQYINENLLDKMTPKSDEDIISAAKKLKPFDRIRKMRDLEIGEEHFPSDKELKKDLGHKMFKVYQDMKSKIKQVEDSTPLKIVGVDKEYQDFWENQIKVSMKYENVDLEDVMFLFTFYLELKKIELKVFRSGKDNGHWERSNNWDDIWSYMQQNIVYDKEKYPEIN